MRCSKCGEHRFRTVQLLLIWHVVWHVKSHQCEPGLKVLSCVHLPPVASLLSRSWETQRPWRPGVSQMQVLQFRNLANAPYAYLLTDKRPMWKISAQFAEGFPAKVESFSHLLHKIKWRAKSSGKLTFKELRYAYHGLAKSQPRWGE